MSYVLYLNSADLDVNEKCVLARSAGAIDVFRLPIRGLSLPPKIQVQQQHHMGLGEIWYWLPISIFASQDFSLRSAILGHHSNAGL